MPILAYAVRDQKGKLIRGYSESRTKEELIRSLQARGLTVVSVEGKKEANLPVKKKRKLHRRARIEDLIIFARQMAVLLESGVPILRAIHVLTLQIESVALLESCRKIEVELRAGSSLRDAVAKHPRIFSQMWVDLIETGEATGQLGFVLQKLADYFEEVWVLKKKVISALIYPAVLIAVSVFAVFIFMYKVIPVFATVYQGLGQLPALTQTVINISNFISQNIVKIVIFIGVAIFGMFKYARTGSGIKFFDSLKLNLPIAGPLFLSIAVERFTTSLSMMLKGGISIVHALEIAIKATANKTLEEALEKVRLSVIQGKTISGPMADLGIFPPMVTQMISVGEESGKLSQLLDEVSKFYSEDVSAKVTRLVSLFEPVVLIVMGVVIGTLVIAMYMPIFTMATSAGGGI